MDILEKMTVLIPIWSFGKAGGIKVLSTLSIYWAKLGIKTVYIAYRNDDILYYPVDGDVIYLDEYGRPSTRCRDVNEKKLFIKRFISLYRFIRKNKDLYDAILANYCMTVYPVFWGNLFSRKNYYYIQCYEPIFFKNFDPCRRFVYSTLAYMTYFIPLKRIVNAEMYKRYKNIRSSKVIYPGLDFKIFFRKSSSDFHSPFRIGTIGREEVWKGTSVVNHAVNLLSKEINNFTYMVAFKNSEAEKCINVKMVKPDSAELLSKFYRDIDVLIAAGYGQHGAIHYPVLEAMASGTLVITTGYYPATTENAIIVPEGKPEIIKEKILEVIEGKIEVDKLIDNAYKAVSEQFSWEYVANQFLTCFRSRK